MPVTRTSSYSGDDTITYIVDFCGFRFFFRYILQFSPLLHPGTPKHSQLQEFLGTLRCFGFVVNVDWALIPGRVRGGGLGRGRGKGEGNVAGPLPSPVCRMKTTHDQVAGEKHEILKLTVL